MRRAEGREQHAENRPGVARASANNALAVAIRVGDWERAALLLLLATAAVARTAPAGTVEDLLALLAGEEVRDEHRR